MSRLKFSSFDFTAATVTFTDSTTGACTLQSTVARGRGQALKCDSTAGNAIARAAFATTSSILGRDYFQRCWFYFDNLPGVTTPIMAFTTISDVLTAKLTSGGKLGLYNGATQIGSDSTATIVTGQWYCVQMKIRINSAALDDNGELYLDEVLVASATGISIATSGPSSCHVGWNAAPGASLVCYLDDWALNDGVGASNTGYPERAAHIVTMLPVSDNAVGTGWVDGDGVGTLFGSVDNVPPLGAGTPADGTQIKNLTSTATANYDANMQTYLAAGVPLNSKVIAVQAYCAHGQPVNSAKNGALQIVSNPVEASEVGFGYGPSGGAVMGAFPTNWGWTRSTCQQVPSVTLGTAPVLRVGKRTATTAEVDVCFMCMHVEFIPPGIPLLSGGGAQSRIGLFTGGRT